MKKFVGIIWSNYGIRIVSVFTIFYLFFSFLPIVAYMASGGEDYDNIIKSIVNDEDFSELEKINEGVYRFLDFTPAPSHEALDLDFGINFVSGKTLEKDGLFVLDIMFSDYIDFQSVTLDSVGFVLIDEEEVVEEEEAEGEVVEEVSEESIEEAVPDEEVQEIPIETFFSKKRILGEKFSLFLWLRRLAVTKSSWADFVGVKTSQDVEHVDEVAEDFSGDVATFIDEVKASVVFFNRSWLVQDVLPCTDGVDSGLVIPDVVEEEVVEEVSEELIEEDFSEEEVVEEVSEELIEEEEVSEEIEELTELEIVENFVKPNFIVLRDRELIAFFSLIDVCGGEFVDIFDVKSLSNSSVVEERLNLSDWSIYFDVEANKIKDKDEDKDKDKKDSADDNDKDRNYSDENEGIENRIFYGGTNIFTIEKKDYDVFDKLKEKKSDDYKKKKFETLRDFVFEYYSNSRFLYAFEAVNTSVYYFDPELIKIKDFDFEDSDNWGDDEFYVVNKGSDFIEDRGLYFIDLVFSQNIDYKNLDIDSFSIENVDGEVFGPAVIFATDSEVLLVFESEEVVDSHLLIFNNVDRLTDNLQDGDVLDGYFSLLQDSDRYIELTSTVNNSYEAYLGNDLVFNAPKISFGKFHDKIETDSTIAVEMEATGSLCNECAIMIFGNDLANSESGDVIPADGLTLLSRSEGEIPVDRSVVEDYELDKQKSFLGFVYISDLEVIDEKYVLYLNLSAPKGLTVGKYETVMSFEVFCPN